MIFTVVIPVYNSAKYIEKTLKSIESATELSDYEVLLIDDCSADIDDLEEVIKAFRNVSLIRKQVKSNAADSRNIGILRSASRYVFLLDSDDCYIPGSIDRRLTLHQKSKAGIIFGNFITQLGDSEKKSILPSYSSEDMRNYILVRKGDMRSSVISIDKENYKNTLFDKASKKHQDWIFAFKCWDNEESIQLDEQYMTIINIDRPSRMSSSLNVEASNYLYDKYLNDVKHINSFARSNWRSMIYDKNNKACKFFIHIYEPQSKSDYLKYYLYKVLSNRAILPFSSRAASKFRNRTFR